MLSLSKIQEDFMLPQDGPQKKTKNKKKKEHLFDDEWLKLVLNGLCPECDGLLEKKGLLRVCTKYKHIHIYGNPILVAYREKITKPKTPVKVVQHGKCPECPSTDFIEDIKTGETICKKCGLVVSGPPDSRVRYPWHVAYSDVTPEHFL